MAKLNPIRETDDKARALATGLLHTARFGALGVIDPESGAPVVTRIAVGTAPDGHPLTLISDLSAHTVALRANPACSLLLGEPADRGDPLTHPRISLACAAQFIEQGSAHHAALRELWLRAHPKARLYVDFADFRFVILRVTAAALNAGFGKAYQLTPADLGLQDAR